MTEEEKGASNGSEDYTQDGTVDLKGRPVLRSKTGKWRACYFIVGYEVFERMTFYGIATNLVIYLSNELHEGTVKSSNNVTNWVGTVWLTPIIGAYIADALLGRYWTFLISSSIYLVHLSWNSLLQHFPCLLARQCGWGVGYGLPTTGLAVSIMVFLLGTGYYRHKTPSGSPFTRIAQVLVAAARKWKVVVPNDPKELHELSLEEYASSAGIFRIDQPLL
ncbi:hypothetical protein K7X08_004941 [Anisodus acutangulus]|uniref:Uncharacterized protein n=1 Tax=Anisodus acutangulus TaxID=402998 RepID=A0A9Q1MEV6_9SOLA|nr:hypothetical protein K7X08_004941 [Anisodus acutangulus]